MPGACQGTRRSAGSRRGDRQARHPAALVRQSLLFPDAMNTVIATVVGTSNISLLSHAFDVASVSVGLAVVVGS